MNRQSVRPPVIIGRNALLNRQANRKERNEPYGNGWESYRWEGSKVEKDSSQGRAERRRETGLQDGKKDFGEAVIAPSFIRFCRIVRNWTKFSLLIWPSLGEFERLGLQALAIGFCLCSLSPRSTCCFTLGLTRNGFGV